MSMIEYYQQKIQEEGIQKEVKWMKGGDEKNRIQMSNPFAYIGISRRNEANKNQWQTHNRMQDYLRNNAQSSLNQRQHHQEPPQFFLNNQKNIKQQTQPQLNNFDDQLNNQISIIDLDFNQPVSIDPSFTISKNQSNDNNNNGVSKKFTIRSIMADANSAQKQQQTNNLNNVNFYNNNKDGQQGSIQLSNESQVLQEQNFSPLMMKTNNNISGREQNSRSPPLLKSKQKPVAIISREKGEKYGEYSKDSNLLNFSQENNSKQEADNFVIGPMYDKTHSLSVDQTVKRIHQNNLEERFKHEHLTFYATNKQFRRNSISPLGISYRTTTKNTNADDDNLTITKSQRIDTPNSFNSSHLHQALPSGSPNEDLIVRKISRRNDSNSGNPYSNDFLTNQSLIRNPHQFLKGEQSYGVEKPPNFYQTLQTVAKNLNQSQEFAEETSEKRRQRVGLGNDSIDQDFVNQFFRQSIISPARVLENLFDRQTDTTRPQTSQVTQTEEGNQQRYESQENSNVTGQPVDGLNFLQLRKIQLSPSPTKRPQTSGRKKQIYEQPSPPQNRSIVIQNHNQKFEIDTKFNDHVRNVYMEKLQNLFFEQKMLINREKGLIGNVKLNFSNQHQLYEKQRPKSVYYPDNGIFDPSLFDILPKQKQIKTPLETQENTSSLQKFEKYQEQFNQTNPRTANSGSQSPSHELQKNFNMSVRKRKLMSQNKQDSTDPKQRNLMNSLNNKKIPNFEEEDDVKPWAQPNINDNYMDINQYNNWIYSSKI